MVIISLTVKQTEDQYGAHLKQPDIEKLAAQLTIQRLVDIVDSPEDWEANLTAAREKTHVPMEAPFICPAIFTLLYPQDAENSTKVTDNL